MGIFYESEYEGYKAEIYGLMEQASRSLFDLRTKLRLGRKDDADKNEAVIDELVEALEIISRSLKKSRKFTHIKEIIEEDFDNFKSVIGGYIDSDSFNYNYGREWGEYSKSNIDTFVNTYKKVVTSTEALLNAITE